MRRNKRYLLWTAAGTVLGLGATSVHATPIVTLSLNAYGGEWTAYAQLDNGTDNVGLVWFAIDVIGAGGVTVTTSYDAAPLGSVQVGTKAYDTGFAEFLSNGVGGGTAGTGAPGNGIGITAAQNVTYGGINIPNRDLDVIQGFGKTPGSQDGFTWAAPTEIAYGTYSGNSGTLSVVPDYNIGHGVQSLNNVSNGKWVGPGNVTFDTVVTGGPVAVNGSGPIVSLIAHDLLGPPPPQYDVAAASASVVTPSSADSNDLITFTGAPVHVHVNAPQTNENFAYSIPIPTNQVDVLLKFVDTQTGTDPATGSILTDIQNYIRSNQFESFPTITSVIPSSVSSQFDGTTFDLLLISYEFGAGDAYLDFSGFSDSSIAPGDLAVSDVGLVPEPAGIALLTLSGIGLICRRRRTTVSNSKVIASSDSSFMNPI